MDIDFISSLNKIDWEFSDFNSLAYPADINFIHWYPGVFVPQIPSILIKALSREGDVVLDPFSGSGITLIEAARIRRRFIGIDLNPFAIDIITAKIIALTSLDDAWFLNEKTTTSKLKITEDLTSAIAVDSELRKWFHIDTLNELFAVKKHIDGHDNDPQNIVQKVLLSSILNRCSSQRDHYTYITDKCFPKQLVYKDAIKAYGNQVDLLHRAVKEAQNQFFRTYASKWNFDESILRKADSRDLSWIASESIDLIVTSPPYLGVNDYTRSMHLSSLIFHCNDFNDAITNEIGARRKRNRKNAFHEYINDMQNNLTEIIRVLKPRKFLALIIGRGRGKVNTCDPIEALLSFLEIRGMHLVFEEQRRIKFRRIQVPGVGNEIIYIFQKR